MTHGGKRPGAGRKKGIANKVTIRTRADLEAYIEQAGPRANPFQRLVDRMLKTRDPQVEIRCAIELCDRLLPKLKAVEHSGEVGYRDMTAADRQARIDDLLAKRNGHAVSG